MRFLNFTTTQDNFTITNVRAYALIAYLRTLAPPSAPVRDRRDHLAASTLQSCDQQAAIRAAGFLSLGRGGGDDRYPPGGRRGHELEEPYTEGLYQHHAGR